MIGLCEKLKVSPNPSYILTSLSQLIQHSPIFVACAISAMYSEQKKAAHSSLQMEDMDSVNMSRDSQLDGLLNHLSMYMKKWCRLIGSIDKCSFVDVIHSTESEEKVAQDLVDLCTDSARSEQGSGIFDEAKANLPFFEDPFVHSSDSKQNCLTVNHKDAHMDLYETESHNNAFLKPSRISETFVDWEWSYSKKMASLSFNDSDGKLLEGQWTVGFHDFGCLSGDSPNKSQEDLISLNDSVEVKFSSHSTSNASISMPPGPQIQFILRKMLIQSHVKQKEPHSIACPVGFTKYCGSNCGKCYL